MSLKINIEAKAAEKKVPVVKKRVVKEFDVPHPYMADYEQQLENDNNISIDDYLNPMFTEPAQEPRINVGESLLQSNNESVDARTFAEEFTEPIHQENTESNRLVEVPQEVNQELPSQELSESVSVLHHQESSSEMNFDGQDESNLSFTRDNVEEDLDMDGPDESKLESVNSENEEAAIATSRQEDQEYIHSKDDVVSSEEREQVEEREESEEELEQEEKPESSITDVLHAENGDQQLEDSNGRFDSDSEKKIKDNHMEFEEPSEQLDYGEMDQEIEEKIPESESKDELNDENQDMSGERIERTIENEEGEEQQKVGGNENEDGELPEDDNDAISGEQSMIADEHETERTEPVEPARPKTKTVTPVTLKKRVSLQASNESSEDRAARRKRRWGSTSIKDSSVTISTESIKKLIPDVKIDAAALDQVELDYQEEEMEQEKEQLEEKESERETPSKSRRTVKLDSAKKVTIGQLPSDETVLVDSDSGEVTQTSKPDKPPTRRPTDADDDSEEPGKRDRSPSPPKNEASCYLHVENLVRPYTINQLKAIISKTGNIQENKIWLDNIKSHCYVMLASSEEATATRQALHGINWPSGSPKTLKADFAVNEKMWIDTKGALGEKQKVVIEIDDKENEVTEAVKEDGKKTTRQEHRERRREREEKRTPKNKEVEKKKDREESPAKLLDDLFRKTKATPCIYWLPLTEEQIREKEKLNEEAKRNPRDNERLGRDRRPERRLSPGRRSPPRRGNGRGNGRGWR